MVDIGNREEYVIERVLETELFRKMIERCNFPPLQQVLNCEWLKRIRNSGMLTWGNNGIPFCGEYLAFHWLFDDEQFEFICRNLKEIYRKTKKLKTLRKKIQGVATNSIDRNEQQAFELAIMCKLNEIGVLVDFDYKISSRSGHNTDALIGIFGQEILVEVTAFDYFHGYDNNKVGAVDLDKNIDIVAEKIDTKHIEQLRYANRPCLLFIRKPGGRLVDDLQCNWAVDQVKSIRNIAGIVFLSDYIIRNGLWYYNKNCSYPLRKEVTDFLSLSQIINRTMLYM